MNVCDYSALDYVLLNLLFNATRGRNLTHAAAMLLGNRGWITYVHEEDVPIAWAPTRVGARELRLFKVLRAASK